MNRSRTARITRGIGVGVFAFAVLLLSSHSELWAQDAPKEHSQKRAQRGKSKEVVLLFEYRSAEIGPAALQELEDVAVWVKKNKRRSVIVKEQVAAAGTAEAPAENASERTDAVKAHLMAQGIADERIIVVPGGQGAAVVKGRRARMLLIAERPGSRQEYEARQAAMENSKALQEVASDVAQTRAELENVRVQVEKKPPPPAPVVVMQEKKVYVKEAAKKEPQFLVPGGMGLSVGGGVMDFFNKNSRSISEMGGTWEARLAYGTRFPIGAEAAYVGSAARLRSAGLANRASLLGTSVEGAMVVGGQVKFVRPYFFGGIGVSRYEVVNTEFNDSNLKDSEVAYYVPVGVGLGFRVGGLMVDFRGTVRPAFGDELQRNTDDGSHSGLGSWAATAKLGWEF